MKGIDCSTKNRRKILDTFDNTKDDEIYILCSCRTIGEGVDTKKANMCVFADPKSSLKDIIQNNTIEANALNALDDYIIV